MDGCYTWIEGQTTVRYFWNECPDCCLVIEEMPVTKPTNKAQFGIWQPKDRSQGRVNNLFTTCCAKNQEQFKSWYVTEKSKHRFFLISQYIEYPVFLPDPRGASLQEALQFLFVRPYVCTSVCPSVSMWLTCVLLGQYTSDLNIYYRFRTPFKMTIRGADQRCL